MQTFLLSLILHRHDWYAMKRKKKGIDVCKNEERSQAKALSNSDCRIYSVLDVQLL